MLKAFSIINRWLLDNWSKALGYFVDIYSNLIRRLSDTYWIIIEYLVAKYSISIQTIFCRYWKILRELFNNFQIYLIVSRCGVIDKTVIPLKLIVTTIHGSRLGWVVFHEAMIGSCKYLLPLVFFSLAFTVSDIEWENLCSHHDELTLEEGRILQKIPTLLKEWKISFELIPTSFVLYCCLTLPEFLFLWNLIIITTTTLTTNTKCSNIYFESKVTVRVVSLFSL